MPSRAWPIAALCLMLSGCGLIMVGQPVEKLDLTSQNDAEENIKAIRAMLADQARHPAGSLVNPSNASPSPLPPNESKPLSEPQSSVNYVMPFSAASTRSINPPAKIPWTPLSISSPGPPHRPVPAYTTLAPVGPDYSGSVRCVLDGMGGQRCIGR